MIMTRNALKIAIRRFVLYYLQQHQATGSLSEHETRQWLDYVNNILDDTG